MSGRAVPVPAGRAARTPALLSGPQRRAAVAATFDQVAGDYDQGGVRWFAPIARRLVQRLAPRPGERALDLGCGRGAALFELAASVGENGTVTGIDLAPRMIEATAEDARARGVRNVVLHVMDAATPSLSPASYDLATASFVLFFLPAPVAALRAWRRLLVPGGRLGISTYDQDEAGLLGELFQPYLPTAAFRPASPFSSDEGVCAAFAASGFSSVQTHSFDLTVSFADADEWYAWSWSHGQRAVWERVPAGERARVRAAAAELLAGKGDGDGRIRLTHRIRLTTGTRPARDDRGTALPCCRRDELQPGGRQQTCQPTAKGPGDMTTATSYADATDAYQMPRLIRLGPNLYGAAFTLMKMVPARYILNKARDNGQLEPGTVIVETTSGTFGLALAMHAVRLDRKLILVSDPVVDDRLYRRLADLGATVERVPASAGAGPGGFQAARLARLRQIQASRARTFCPEQYTNPDNPAAYASVAELMLDRLGQIDCIVGPIGSGGSMCGTTRRLRASLPGCLAIGVDTHGSVLFGQDDAKRELRGLGMSVLPANLDHQVFDEVHWCAAPAAYRATRELHQRHALFMGPTSGAAYLVGRWWAKENPDAVTVVMMPDEGHRYQDTVYNDEWLAAAGHRDEPAPSGPASVDQPWDATEAWTSYQWGRRSYADVMGDPGIRAAAAAGSGLPAGSR